MAIEDDGEPQHWRAYLSMSPVTLDFTETKARLVGAINSGARWLTFPDGHIVNLNHVVAIEVIDT